MSTINKHFKLIVNEKLQILTNLFFKVYPELKNYVTVEKTDDVLGNKIIIDNETLYIKFSSPFERNNLNKMDLTLNERINEFIKMKYPELIDLTNYYLYCHLDDIIEKDLLDMNITYKQLKSKLNNGIFC